MIDKGHCYTPRLKAEIVPERVPHRQAPIGIIQGVRYFFRADGALEKDAEQQSIRPWLTPYRSSSSLLVGKTLSGGYSSELISWRRSSYIL